MTEPKSNVRPVTTAPHHEAARACALALDTLARDGGEILFQVVAVETVGGIGAHDVPVLATVSRASAFKLRDDMRLSGMASTYRVDVFDPRFPTGWRPLP